jgi:hypothetical protein
MHSTSLHTTAQPSLYDISPLSSPIQEDLPSDYVVSPVEVTSKQNHVWPIKAPPTARSTNTHNPLGSHSIFDLWKILLKTAATQPYVMRACSNGPVPEPYTFLSPEQYEPRVQPLEQRPVIKPAVRADISSSGGVQREPLSILPVGPQKRELLKDKKSLLAVLCCFGK